MSMDEEYDDGYLPEDPVDEWADVPADDEAEFLYGDMGTESEPESAAESVPESGSGPEAETGSGSGNSGPGTSGSENRSRNRTQGRTENRGQSSGGNRSASAADEFWDRLYESGRIDESACRRGKMLADLIELVNASSPAMRELSDAASYLGKSSKAGVRGRAISREYRKLQRDRMALAADLYRAYAGAEREAGSAVLNDAGRTDSPADIPEKKAQTRPGVRILECGKQAVRVGCAVGASVLASLHPVQGAKNLFRNVRDELSRRFPDGFRGADQNRNQDQNQDGDGKNVPDPADAGEKILDPDYGTPGEMDSRFLDMLKNVQDMVRSMQDEIETLKQNQNSAVPESETEAEPETESETESEAEPELGKIRKHGALAELMRQKDAIDAREDAAEDAYEYA